MKVSSLLSHRTALSLEIFPPRRTVPVDTICNTLDRLKGITPDFTSVTYRMGGNENSQTTLKIAFAIKRKYGTESMARIPCLNLTEEDALLILEQLKEQRIENMLALRGDRIPDKEPTGDFRYASDLMEFIKLHGDPDIIDTCYPEGHQESGGLVRDTKHLKDKANAGVSQLITQFFFDNEYLHRFRERMDLVGIHVPVEVGIMPTVSKKQVEHMVPLCGVKLPKKFIPMMGHYGSNPIAMQDTGIVYAVDQIVDLVTDGVDGIHLYTMSNPYTTSRIYEPVFRLVTS